MATAKRDLTDPQVQGRLLSIEEACAFLGVSHATLYRYMANGELRFHKLNRTRMVDEGDLLECKDNRAAGKPDALERARMQRRAAAHALHSLYDSRRITQPARDAFFRRFELAVDPNGLLPLRERKRRAEQAKTAYFTDLARRSSKARDPRYRAGEKS